MNLDTLCYFQALEEYRSATRDERMPEELPLDTLSVVLARAQELKAEKVREAAELDQLVEREAAQL